MTLGDVLSTLNQNRELIATVLGTMIAAIFGKRKYDQVKATAEQLLAQAFTIADDLVARLIKADAVTSEALEALVGEWRTTFVAVTRALHIDVTPEQLAAITEKVRNHVITAVASYTKLRSQVAFDSLDRSARKWDHLINEVSPKHHAKLKAAAERTRKRREARAAKTAVGG